MAQTVFTRQVHNLGLDLGLKRFERTKTKPRPTDAEASFRMTVDWLLMRLLVATTGLGPSLCVLGIGGVATKYFWQAENRGIFTTMQNALSKKLPAIRQPSSLDGHSGWRGGRVANGGVLQKRVQPSVARRGALDNSPGYRPVLSLFSARRAIYRSIGSEFEESEFSEIRFVTLVALYAFEPKPATAEILALHADVSRTRMNETIEDLECRGLVVWSGSNQGRQTYVRLTKLGRRFTSIAVRRFLQVASEASSTHSRSGTNEGSPMGSDAMGGLTAHRQPRF